MRFSGTGEAMEKRRLFDAGDLVADFTGEIGMVLSMEGLQRARVHFKEGGRPGRFFAPGCCRNPDYVTQVPVFFEDGTYDIMRAMNLRRRKDLPAAKQEELEKKLACRQT